MCELESSRYRLFYMRMIGNVVFTVAEVAVTPGAVTELQIRIGYIRASANCAFVGVGLGLLRFNSVHRSSGPFGITDSSLQEGEEIDNILAGKEQIVQKSHKGEEIVWEDRHRVADNFQSDHKQIDNAHKPSFNWDDKQHQKLTVRVGCSKDQQQTQV